MTKATLLQNFKRIMKYKSSLGEDCPDVWGHCMWDKLRKKLSDVDPRERNVLISSANYATAKSAFVDIYCGIYKDR